MYLAGQRLALGGMFNTALLAASVLLVYQQILIGERTPEVLGLFSATTTGRRCDFRRHSYELRVNQPSITTHAPVKA